MLSNQSSFSDFAAGIDPAILTKHLNAAFAEDQSVRQRERMSDFPPQPSIQDYLDARCFDAAVRRAAEWFADLKGRPAPMVMADTYDKVCSSQEPFYAIWSGRRTFKYKLTHPKRPVFMRGSRMAREATSTKTDYYLCIQTRFLRFKKITVLDRSDVNILQRVTVLFRKRYNLSYHFTKWSESSSAYIRLNEGCAFLHGRWVQFTESELKNIKRLSAIIQKTEKLDKRLALARQSKRY